MNGNKSIFCIHENDYSITQLLRMVSRKANKKKHTKAFTSDDLAILITNGSITMETSSTDIKNIIDKYCMETVEGIAEELPDETEDNGQTREFVCCYVNGRLYDNLDVSDCVRTEMVKANGYEYMMMFDTETLDCITVLYREK